jgi:hypothetical protein
MSNLTPVDYDPFVQDKKAENQNQYTPVDYDPFAKGDTTSNIQPKLTPVDHDPFIQSKTGILDTVGGYLSKAGQTISDTLTPTIDTVKEYVTPTITPTTSGISPEVANIQNLKGISTMGIYHPEQEKAGAILRQEQAYKQAIEPIQKAMEAQPEFYKGRTAVDVLKQGIEAEKAGTTGEVQQPWVDPIDFTAFILGGGLPSLARTAITGTARQTASKAIELALKSTAIGLAQYPIGQTTEEIAKTDLGKQYPQLPLAFNFIANGAAIYGIDNAVKNLTLTDTWRTMTIPERNLIVQSIDDLKAKGMTEGKIARYYPSYKEQMIAERMPTEQPIVSKSPLGVIQEMEQTIPTKGATSEPTGAIKPTPTVEMPTVDKIVPEMTTQGIIEPTIAEQTIKAEQLKYQEALAQGNTREQQLKGTHVNQITADTATDLLLDGKSIEKHIKEGIDSGLEPKVIENNVRELLNIQYAKESDPLQQIQYLKAEKQLNKDVSNAYEKKITKPVEPTTFKDFVISKGATWPINTNYPNYPILKAEFDKIQAPSLQEPSVTPIEKQTAPPPVEAPMLTDDTQRLLDEAKYHKSFTAPVSNEMNSRTGGLAGAIEGMAQKSNKLAKDLQREKSNKLNVTEQKLYDAIPDSVKGITSYSKQLIYGEWEGVPRVGMSDTTFRKTLNSLIAKGKFKVESYLGDKNRELILSKIEKPSVETPKTALEQASEQAKQAKIDEEIKSKQVGLPEGKQSWEMTKEEYRKSTVNQPAYQMAEQWVKDGIVKIGDDFYNKPIHELYVKQAISEGKQVPPEVLKDYPDLAKEIKPIEPTPTVPSDIQAIINKVDTGKKLSGDEALKYADYKASLKVKTITPEIKEKPIFKTGQSVEFGYLKNKEKSPYMGSRYGQDIEPKGNYVTQHDLNDKYLIEKFPDKYEMGSMRFENPLVIKVEEPLGHKKILYDKYKKKGEALSKAIIADGYDGVVTVRGNGETGEIIDLRKYVSPKIPKPTELKITKNINSIVDKFNKDKLPITVADLKDTTEFKQGQATLNHIAEILKDKNVEVTGKIPLTALEKKQRDIIKQDIKFRPMGQSGFIDIGILKELPKIITDPFRDFNPDTILYKDTNKAVDSWRKTRNYGALKAQQARETILKLIPNKTERESITYALDEPLLTEKLTPKQMEVYNGAKAMYDSYKIVLKDEGMLNNFIDDYVNRIIKEMPKKGKLKPTSIGGQLGTKPSFIKQRVRTEEGRPYTIRELEDMGYVVEKDIANIAAFYQITAEQVIANKRLVDFLKETKTKDGNKVLRLLKDVPFEDRKQYILVDEMQLKKWSGKKINDETTQLFQLPTGLHKDAWYLVDNILRDRRPPSVAYKLYAHARGGVKRLIMFNPFIHGFNIESNVIMELGIHWPERFKTRTPQEVDALKERMVRNGVELEGLFDVNKRLLYDIYELKVPDVKTINHMITHPIATLRNLGDKILWDKWVKSGQMIIYEDLERKYLAQGLSEAEAGNSAAMVTNDLMGTLPSTWFTKNQRRILFNLMFARNWTISNLRTLTGTLGRGAKSIYLPKMLRFENVSDEELKSMGSSYRKIVLKGIIGLIITSNVVQAISLKANNQKYHPTWQNEEGHWIDIDTGMIDTKGRKIYLKNWLFRQIDDYIKLAEGHPIQFARAKLEPIMRTIAEVVLNVDYRGEPIVPKGANRVRALTEIGRYVVKGVTPLDNLVGREDEVRTWGEALLPLTGTWVRHGMPIGTQDARFGDILKGYYEYKQKKALLRNDIQEKVTGLIQQGKDAEAFKLIDEIELTSLDVLHIETRLKFPFIERITQIMPNGSYKIQSDFMEYIILLPKNKQDMVRRAIQGIPEETTNINIPSETQSKKEFIQNKQ